MRGAGRNATGGKMGRPSKTCCFAQLLVMAVGCVISGIWYNFASVFCAAPGFEADIMGRISVLKFKNVVFRRNHASRVTITTHVIPPHALRVRHRARALNEQREQRALE